MDKFVFDKKIFHDKFIRGEGLNNVAKNTQEGLESVCPVKSKNGNVCQGYKPMELLVDTLHYILGRFVTGNKGIDIEEDLFQEINKQVHFETEQSKVVFMDFLRSMYFDNHAESTRISLPLLRYQPTSEKRDFGKLMVDVLMDNKTKEKFLKILEHDETPFDDIINKSYEQLGILDNHVKQQREYASIFGDELKELFIVMNSDFQNVLDSRTDVQEEMEFLLTYYLFIYLSQIAIRLDADLDEIISKHAFPLFKGGKEAISEDRDCVVRGWRMVDVKIKKLFKHLVVLNMLNCHDSSAPYYKYSDFFKIYCNHIELRQDMDEAVDYLIQQYTKVYRHSTDTQGEYIDFSKVPFAGSMDAYENYKAKIRYLFQCVSFQLDGKDGRRKVYSYVASNYSHILKMRFVKSWGQLGHMLMISNDDLILMIQICQKSSKNTDHERGIPIRDLFDEFRKRGLYMDGKTEQYIINYLIDINLIDSKCDSEEAQYVKRIR